MLHKLEIKTKVVAILIMLVCISTFFSGCIEYEDRITISFSSDGTQGIDPVFSGVVDSWQIHVFDLGEEYVATRITGTIYRDTWSGSTYVFFRMDEDYSSPFTRTYFANFQITSSDPVSFDLNADIGIPTDWYNIVGQYLIINVYSSTVGFEVYGELFVECISC